MEWFYILLISVVVLLAVIKSWGMCLKNGWLAYKNRRNQLKMLGNVVSTATGNPSKLKLIYITCSVIFKAIWITFMNKLHKNVKKIGRNLFEVKYCLNGRQVIFVIEVKRGPSSILQVIDENEEDITDKVDSYLNYNDIIIKKMSPVDLGYENLTINMSNGDVKTFDQEEKIILE